MDKSKLQGIGGSIALAGLASIVLAFIGFNLRILMWIDAWGEGLGWVIRVGILLLGGAIYGVGALAGKESTPAAADAD